MKATGLISLFLILLLAGPALAGASDTVDFEIDRLFIDFSEKSVQYGDLDMIRDAGFPSVPYDRLYYSGVFGESETDISAVIIRADTIELGFQSVLNRADIATSDIELPVIQPTVFERLTACFPSEPIRVTSQVVRDEAIRSILVFPVQYLDDGRIIFNHQVEINVADESITGRITPFIPEGKEFSEGGPVYFKSPMDPPENDCPLGNQYVIVTSPELAEAFDEFLSLKIETGFDAAIALTDSIFELYDGIDEAEALRNYLSEFYQHGGEYVLLGGDEDHVPVRYTYYYNTEISQELEFLMICDLYFSDFDGNWDADGDGIWGEPNSDQPDLGAEVAVGRLPFSDSAQVAGYTKKLRQYLFNPGQGDRQYLDRAVFIASDQMVDYFDNAGQQHYVADYIPSDISVDCDLLAESPTGDAFAPTSPFPPETISSLDEGYGFINILAHGRPDGFILNSSEYNQFPKSYLLTGDEHIGNGAFADLAASGKVAFYYTISCSQGAFDLEDLYDIAVPSVVEKLLDLDSAGAMGVIAFSRWGWVGSSFRLMASFYEHLFGNADGYPVEAMYRTYLEYPFYTDQIYGQNYHGDPSIMLYSGAPAEIVPDVPEFYEPSQPITCRFALNGGPYSGKPVVVRIGTDQYETVMTDGEGMVRINLPDDCLEPVVVTAFEPGVISASKTIQASIAADIDDDEPLLPLVFGLHQNYPNPFNPSTVIEFSLTRHQQVTLQIYDILGRLINSPVDRPLPAGEHQVVWDGTNHDGDVVSSGVYFYRLVSEEGNAVKKMMLLR
jgi:hypothetical protein